MPIYEYPDKYSSHQIMRTLLDPNIDTAKIAQQRPLETNKSATFIVDIRSLKHRDDIKKDMYGKWVHHGSHTDVFKCSFDELSDICVERAALQQLFIREVRTLHEPAIVVATNLQLNDLDWFCCQQEKFGILTVDPTFCLGNFDVTLSTYRHLPLAFIGPAMIHYILNIPFLHIHPGWLMPVSI